MNREERVRAAVSGAEPDRVPVSVWFHFSADDQDPVSLADATSELIETYDYDFVKMMPFGLYSVQDLGAKIKIYCQKGKPPVTVGSPIKTPADYLKLHFIPAIQGTYGKQLEFTELLAQRLRPDTPFIQTIFSPLTTLHKLAGDRVLEDLKTNPAEVRHALEVITEITIDFVNENIKRGVSGFFFATQEARPALISPENFQSFAAAYDVPLIESYSSRTWFNVAHIHGLDVYFDEVAAYPVNVINWHDRNTSPSLAEARGRSSKAFLAGIRAATKLVDGQEVRDDIAADGTPEAIISHIREAIESAGGRRLLIGPGCCVAQDVAPANLRAIREAVNL